jgi:glycosyltransferase involved in cell wall biosynthesis
MIRRWATDRNFTIRLLFEPHPGLSRARNMALAAARGRIIAMTDDDCVLHPDYFQALAAAFAGISAPAIIGGRILLGDPGDLPVTVKLEDHPMTADPDGFPGGFVMGANLAFSAEVRAMVGPFDERFGAGAPFRAAEDTDFLFRAQAAGIPVLYDPRFVVDHHHGRRHEPEAVALLAGYGFGDGALYAKHLWSDRRIGRWLRDDIRNLRLRFTGPVPAIRHFHAFRLRHVLAGFVAYARVAITSRRPSARRPSSA